MNFQNESAHCKESFVKNYLIAGFEFNFLSGESDFSLTSVFS